MAFTSARVDWMYDKYVDELESCADYDVDRSERLSNFKRIIDCPLWFNYQFDTVDTICTAIKLNETAPDSINECIIGYLYSSLVADTGTKSRISSQKRRRSGGISLDYISMGASFISRDGEYRSMVIPTHKIMDFNILGWNKIEAYVTSFLSKRKFVFKIEHFFPRNEFNPLKTHIEKLINEFDMEFKTFILLWLYEVLLKSENIDMHREHVNAHYISMMQKRINDDVKFIRTFDTNKLIQALTKVGFDFTRGVSGSIGQKLVPVSIQDVEEPFNMSRKTWRELIVTLNVSRFILNAVSPSFYLSGQWFYVRSIVSNRSIYDTPIQFLRNRASRYGHLMVEKMLQAHWIAGEYNAELIAKNAREELELDRNRKQIEAIDNSIQKVISSTKKDIILSDVSICIMFEYVGLPADEFILYKGTAAIDDRMMFELCYALLCLNAKLGVIHADLHLNNVVYSSGVSHDKKQIVYQIHDDLYTFDVEEETHLHIIDYSRVIVYHENINALDMSMFPVTKESFKPRYNALKNYILQICPKDFSAKADLLMHFIKRDYDSAFKVATLLDVILYTELFLSKFEHNTIVNTVYKKARSMFLRQMDDIFNGKPISKWPIRTLIYEIFGKYVKYKPKRICDFYTFNCNFMKSNCKLGLYSSSYLHNYPSYLREPIIYVRGKEKLLTDETSQCIYKKRIKYEKKREENIHIVNYIAKRHIEKYF